MFKIIKTSVLPHKKKILITIIAIFSNFFVTNSRCEIVKEGLGFSAISELSSKKIGLIIFEGLNLINKTTALEALPSSFRSGLIFPEEISSSLLIQKIMATGLFETVKLLKKENNLTVDFKFVVVEKKILGEYEVLGELNTISAKKIITFLNLKNVSMICEHDLKGFVAKIIEEYKKKSVFDVNVEAALFFKEGSKDEVNLKIKIKEGAAVLIRKINYIGCKEVDSMILRKYAYCKEAWPLKMAFGGGVFSQEIVDADKQMISKIYADRGYYQAKVTEVLVKNNSDEPTVNLTFFINEGPCYKVRLISFPDEEKILPPATLRKIIPLKRGDFFSQSKLQVSVEIIKDSFGSGNYLFCDVYPEVTSCIDINGDHVLDIFFSIEKGDQVRINNINITGNTKTHDEVIRRELNVFEGGMANKIAMDGSLRRLASLGYFDTSTLDWKIVQKDSKSIDLELDLKEVRTGQASCQLQLKGGAGSSSTGTGSKQGVLGDAFAITLTGVYRKRNLFGLGWDMNSNLSFSGTRFSGVDFDFFNPSLFNKDLCFGFKFYSGSQEYREYQRFMINDSPSEISQGILGSFGYYIFPQGARIKTSLDLGYDLVSYSNYQFNRNFENTRFSQYLDARLKSGSFGWIGLQFTKDTLNHPLYPSEGWRANLNLKMLPEQGSIDQKFGMYKAELSGSYCTSLIGKDKLVFTAMGKLGMIFGHKNPSTTIPFKDLFMFGGTDSIRGFRWGEAGPTDRRLNTSLGAKKMLLGRFELVTPLAMERDFDIGAPRFYVFYDIGTAWNSPALDLGNNLVDKSKSYVANDLLKNNFNVRQTIGIGVRLTAPQPVKIEWGFKLDKDRKSKERPAEWHLSVNMPMDL